MLANSDLLDALEDRLDTIRLRLGDATWNSIQFATILQQYHIFDRLWQARGQVWASKLQREDEDPNSASKQYDSKRVQEKGAKIGKTLAALAAPSAAGAAIKLGAPIVQAAPGVNLVGAVIAPWIAWADLAAKYDTLSTLHDINKGLDPDEVGGPTLKCTCECPDKMIGWVPGFEDYSDKQRDAIRRTACYQNVLYFIAKKEGGARDVAAGAASLGSYSALRVGYSVLKRLAQAVSGQAGDKENHCRSLHKGARDSKCHLAMTMLHMICKEKKWYGEAYSTLTKAANGEVDWELPPSDPTTKAEILRSVAIIVASDGWEQIKSCV